MDSRIYVRLHFAPVVNIDIGFASIRLLLPTVRIARDAVRSPQQSTAHSIQISERKQRKNLRRILG
jgi:hypothetical protein